jgi:hypothetical protein
VSAHAHADDTKSTRERKFVFSIMGIKFTVVLLLFAEIWAILKFQFPHSIFGRDILISASAFFVLVLGIRLAGYKFYRQRKIQIEDNTFDEAEWKSPRSETDLAASTSRGKPYTHIKALKRMALLLVVFVVVALNARWKQHLVQSILLSAVWPVVMVCLLLRSEQKRSRYPYGPPGIVVFSVIAAGLSTLYAANLDFYKARADPSLLNVVSPTEIFTFNLVVILAYGLVVGYLVRSRHLIKLRAFRQP